MKIEVLKGQGSVTLIDSMGDDKRIVNAARVSFGKNVEELSERDIRLIKYLYENKHTSPFEHVTFTFLISCPLFVRSQWHRHRTWSYNEISRRYTEENVRFYIPGELRTQSKNDRQSSVNVRVEHEQELITNISSSCLVQFMLYKRLLDEGVCREQARMVLPQSMMTEFYGTVNLHNLIAFIKLRDSEHAQKEIREYAIALKRLMKEIVPITYSAILK